MDPKRRRRRQRRAGAVSAFMVLALGLAFFFESQATTTVIVVRHADVVAALGEDPDLTPQGAIRAEELARVLVEVDVDRPLKAILVAPGEAYRETAEPLARRINLPVQEVDITNPDALAKWILKKYKGEIVLVVTDAMTIPTLIPEFQGSKRVPDLADGEYDNLYVVSIPWYGRVKTLRVRYGSRPAPLARVSPPAS